MYLIVAYTTQTLYNNLQNGLLALIKALPNGAIAHHFWVKSPS